MRLPIIDTGDEALDVAFATLVEAATAVRPTTITPGQARSILRLLADAESECHERAPLCRSCAASARMRSVGAVLLRDFFKETHE